MTLRAKLKVVLHTLTFVIRGSTVETVTRTVRFKKDEIERIDRFLADNSLFDFSSLVRHAVEGFIRQPKVSLKPLTDSPDKRPRRRPDV